MIMNTYFKIKIEERNNLKIFNIILIYRICYGIYNVVFNKSNIEKQFRTCKLLHLLHLKVFIFHISNIYI